MDSDLELKFKDLVSGASEEPLYFPANARRLFGWLHLPKSESTADVALVICKPFGYEALCGHRSVRSFAKAAAASGIPTLNFDYAGTGDSADIDPAADQIETWCQDTISAVTELRQRTGARHVCLLGFRLGALLAILAARRTSIEAIVLIAPVLSGRAYLRELQTTRMMAARRLESVSSATDDGSDRAAADGSIEASGYYLSASSIAALTQLEVASFGAPQSSALFVIDRSGLPTARAWTESVAEQGIDAEYTALPGFVEMMMTPPQYTRTPYAMIERVREWLLRFASRVARPVTATQHRAWPSSETMLVSIASDGSAREDQMLTERPIRFGPNGMLFGVVTEPPGDPAQPRAVVFVNAGADSHVCVGRIYVTLARHWARRGYVVVRMDLAGIGDSDNRPGRPDNEVYPPTAIEDIRAAIDLLRSHYRVCDVTLAGLCSGAYHALRAAVAALPLNRIFLVNPQIFFWHEGADLADIQLVEVISAGRTYGDRVRSAEYWRKLLTGRVNVGYILRVYLHRLTLWLTTSCRALARSLHFRLANDLARELEEIVARGVHITIVFARGEPGIELLRLQSGSTVDRLRDRCRLHIIDGADHTFSNSASRIVLEQVLSEALLT